MEGIIASLLFSWGKDKVLGGCVGKICLELLKLFSL